MQQEQGGKRPFERFEVCKNPIKAFFVHHATADADDKCVGRDPECLARTCTFARNNGDRRGNHTNTPAHGCKPLRMVGVIGAVCAECICMGERMER